MLVSIQAVPGNLLCNCLHASKVGSFWMHCTSSSLGVARACIPSWLTPAFIPTRLQQYTQPTCSATYGLNVQANAGTVDHRCFQPCTCCSVWHSLRQLQQCCRRGFHPRLPAQSAQWNHRTQLRHRQWNRVSSIWLAPDWPTYTLACVCTLS